MTQTKKPPVEKLFGIKKLGKAGWVMTEIHVQDGKIVKTRQTEPDFRDIALEHLNRAISQFWLEEQ